MDVVPGLVGGFVAFGMVIVRWWRGAVGPAAPAEWTTLPFARRRAIKAAVRSGRLVAGAEHEQRIAAELASGLLRRYGWGTRLRWGAFSGLYGVYWMGIGLYEGDWVRLAL